MKDKEYYQNGSRLCVQQMPRKRLQEEEELRDLRKPSHIEILKRIEFNNSISLN